MRLIKSFVTIFPALIAFSKARSGFDSQFAKPAAQGINRTVFKHAATKSSLEYVTNSRICETTPGVNQYSGYLDYSQNASMWFWFFEARNKPREAPLVLWLNGGPGCSSEIGVFQENGPCHFIGENDTEPTLNPYSWNEYANMIYIDQPIGTGFSEGAENEIINSTVEAAPYVWIFMQAFLDNFPEYMSRDFGLFTESYGGHYGPKFAEYFLKQNDKIRAGSLHGHEINLVALGINNPWIDPMSQFKAYVTYAYKNPYRQIINESLHEHFIDLYEKECVPLLEKCTNTTMQLEACSNASLTCNTIMYDDLIEASGVDFGVNDIRIGSQDVDPAETYVDYLNREDVRKKIGARKDFEECNLNTFYKFGDTGDDARPYSNALTNVVNRNMTTLIWVGDADWSCSWPGVLEAVNSLNWHGQSEFTSAELKNYTVNGECHGTYRTIDNLSLFKVHGAGHYVSYYQPETALQVFKQTMQQRRIFST
ncbi:unnamed protein product [Fusarium venenatum]|uniref:Carboxypeptidase n=1 Tax=Fusarium venenatum TaxID=56646 RepID=A0A2L2TAW8_9HYPO|nr:uncharacterized protein FVRRES_04502 [Fusarium venenatum]KAH6991663.1 Alpha/Beta hydrolase protein [Fusarium venenatum]CEI60066.1 unnamed protein product [Fusarium venenatum]